MTGRDVVVQWQVRGVIPTPAGREDPKENHDEDDEEDRERHFGIDRESSGAHDISEGFHGAVAFALATAGAMRLMSVPSRCR